MTSKALLTFVVAASSAAFATAIPQSAIGINKTVSITGHPYNAAGGGGFSAIVDGFTTTVWCVDVQNFISPGAASATYTANVTLVGPWASGMNSLVRKGTEANWSDGLTLTPLDRYQGAAWLLEQYTGFPNGPATNASPNTDIQNAIWRMTHSVAGGGSAPAANSYFNNAVSFVNSPAGNAFGFGKWAVISGIALPNGTLTGDTRQTFMVQVVPAPEPATYAMMGSALIGLAFMIRRKKSS